MRRWRSLLLFLVFVVLFTACGGQNSVTPHQRAIQYLQAALTFIQHNSVNIDKIDWTAIQHEALAQAQGAQTPAQTYPAIQWTLQQLGDNHSFFLTPVQANQFGQGEAKDFGMTISSDYYVIEIYPGSPADKAGVQVGDQVEQVNGAIPGNDLFSLLRAPSATFTLIHRGQTRSFKVRLTAATYDRNLQPQWRLLAGNIGYIELPALEGGSMVQHYANIVQRDIAELDQAGVLSWIIDLRLNEGGTMWPMLAGIGPVLGEGKAGSFVFQARIPPQTWFYRNGQALVDQTVQTQVTSAYHLRHGVPPVAVLTSQYTASSGEAIVVAFHARPHTRSFGEPTAGVPTANTGTTLSDGALLVVTDSLDADRTGTTYDSAIPPDQSIPADWRLLGTADDPPVQAATAWLRTQKA